MPNQVKCGYCGKVIRYEGRRPRDCPDCYESLPRAKAQTLKNTTGSRKSNRGVEHGSLTRLRPPDALRQYICIAAGGVAAIALALLSTMFNPSGSDVSLFGTSEADKVAFPEIAAAVEPDPAEQQDTTQKSFSDE